MEGEDWDLLHASVQEVLKASVMARVNVMSSPLSSLLDTVKGLCSGLTMLVPSALYLPSPPLYCPQPSPNTQVHKIVGSHSYLCYCSPKKCIIAVNGVCVFVIRTQ